MKRINNSNLDAIQEFRKKFGKNLTYLRELKKMSADDLAIKGELSSKSYIYSIERGEKDIQLSTIFKLAKGLDIDPKDLLNFDIN